MRSFLLLSIFFFLWTATPAQAEEFIAPDSFATTNPADSRAADIEADRRPFITSQATWAGIAVIVILGAFLAAAVIGPIVRVEIPRALPYAFSHHEDPTHHSGLDPDDQGETPPTLE